MDTFSTFQLCIFAAHMLVSRTVTVLHKIQYVSSQCLYHGLLHILLIAQLQVKLSSKERRVKGLKEEVHTLKLRLSEEEQRVASLRSQRAAVEEELETVMEVITHLSPHSERSVSKQFWVSGGQQSGYNGMKTLDFYRTQGIFMNYLLDVIYLSKLCHQFFFFFLLPHGMFCDCLSSILYNFHVIFSP